MILLIEKTNHKFKRVTNSRQGSGLSVCLNMISSALDDVLKIEVDNMEHVNLAIMRFRPSKVIYQALWASEHQIYKLKNAYPNVKFYVHIHSNIPFLGTEGYAMARINEARHMGIGIIVNSERAFKAIDGSIYLPNIYVHPFLDRPEQRKPNESEAYVLNIICAGSLRPMKNHLTQAMAAIKFADLQGKKMRFHVNSRGEGGDDIKYCLNSLFESTGHSLVSIPWLDHGEFMKYLSIMDYGMQVSMSESFNLVAADYSAAELPMVVSDEIEWADHRCKVPTGDVSVMVQGLYRAHESVAYNRENLRSFSKNSVKVWERFHRET